MSGIMEPVSSDLDKFIALANLGREGIGLWCGPTVGDGRRYTKDLAKAARFDQMPFDALDKVYRGNGEPIIEAMRVRSLLSSQPHVRRQLILTDEP